MKEIDCLCGERIVFLDEEVQVKTCPNCGAPVYQHGLPSAFQETIKLKRPRRRAAAGYWMAGLLGVILLVVVAVAAVSVARTKGLARASADEKRAEAARLTGDLYISAELYRRALSAYRKWGAGGEAVLRVRNALAEIEAALEEAGGESGASPAGMLRVSLEELARQAYTNGPDSWRGQFERDIAGRWVLLQGCVAKPEGSAYKASALTISYRVFSPEGREVEVSFDEPFFERYRMKPGDECIVKAVLRAMEWERGTSAEAGRWVLVVDGSESRLLTGVEELRTIGWQMDENLEELIARQSSLARVF